MTLQQLGYPIAVPRSPFGLISAGVGAFAALETLDADDEQVAQIILLPKAGDITKVHFRTGTVATGQDVEVRLETVTDADGDPSGALWGATTDALVTIAGGDDDTWKVATLTSAATVSASDVGKPLAIVIKAPVGFTAGGGNLQIDHGSGFYTGRVVYDVSYWAKTKLGGAGSWTDIGYQGDRSAGIRLEYSDGSFGFLQTSYSGDENPVNVSGITNATTPDEIGIKLRFPYSFRANGIWLNYLHSVASDIKVYIDGTDVEQMTLPQRQAGWVAREITRAGSYFGYGDTFMVLANTWYRITVSPTGSSNDFRYIPQSTDAHWACWGLSQADYKWTERTDAGAWTDRDDRILPGGFLMDQIHDGAASILGGGQLTGGFA